MLKIFHTGDVHLDSPFSGLSPDAAHIRRSESRAVFTSMMTYVRTGDVDMVLVAGDLFDSRFVTRSTVAFVMSEFEKLPCPVYISPGNHDPYSADSVWEKIDLPQNVRVFNSEVIQRYSDDIPGVDVYGYAFTSNIMKSSPLASAKAADPSRISIICAHGDMSSPLSPYAPLSKEILSSFGADYAALGHIHNPEGFIGEAGDCVYAYCGCPEGRSFDECGEKGALVIEIGKENASPKITVRPMKFSHRRYEVVTVNVDGAASMSDVIRASKAAAGADDPSLALRLRLTGSVDPALVISKTELCRAMEGMFSVEVRDETLPLWKGEYLENDLTVRGEAYRTLKPMLESADERERLTAIGALRYIFAAMSGENISDI